MNDDAEQKARLDNLWKDLEFLDKQVESFLSSVISFKAASGGQKAKSFEFTERSNLKLCLLGLAGRLGYLAEVIKPTIPPNV
jgi:hypothetical protein